MAPTSGADSYPPESAPGDPLELPPLGHVKSEQAFAAERRIAGVRLAVILSGSILYPLMDPRGTTPWLAYSLLGAAWAYGVFVWRWEPYRRAPVLLSSYLTTTVDAAFTLLWLFATGGFASPFYVALYMAVFAVAFRFGPRPTIFATVLYGGSYAALVVGLGQLPGNEVDLAVRTTYLALAALLGAIVSQEVYAQQRARLEMQALIRATKEAEGRFRELLDSAPDAILIADAGGRLQFANRQAEFLFGIPKEGLVGSAIHRLVPDSFQEIFDHRQAWFGERSQVLFADASFEREGHRKDGSTVPLEIRLRPLMVAHENLVVVSARDVTVRKRAETELQHQTERYESLLRAQSELGHGVVVLSEERVLYANEAVANLLEYSPSELAELPTLLSRVHAGDRTRFAAELRAHQLAALPASVGEVRMNTQGGRTMHVAYSMKRSTANAHVQVIAILQDVTQRHEQAEKLTHVTSALHDAQRLAALGSWEWEIPINRVTWSPELYRIYGIGEDSGPLTYERFLDSVHPEDRPLVDRTVRESLQNGHPFNFDHRIIRPDGQVRWLHGRGQVEVDANGTALRMFGTGQDISARKQSEEQRAQAWEAAREVERLHELDRLKTNFINTAAHELATPLTPLMLQLPLLKQALSAGSTGDAARSITIIERNLNRMLRLVEDILEAGRMHAARLGVRKLPVDLRSIVVEAGEIFRSSAEAGGVEFEIIAAPAHAVEADAGRIGQVLDNLLANALRFTPPGGRITMEVVPAAEAATVLIQDTGMGFTREQREQMFRPFSQVQEPLRAGPRGSGLGLYISRGIVELHGGTLWCESPGPQRGSTFGFSLPLTSAPPPPGTPEPPAGRPGAPPPWERARAALHATPPIKPSAHAASAARSSGRVRQSDTP